MIKNITAKTILNKVKSDEMFGLTYNLNLYRGCQHNCVYCDSYSSCYQIENFSDILVKSNAPELLDSELSKKRIKGTIGTGSMNDPYMPIEADLGLTRKCLQIIAKRRFPVHIITKSDLVLRDIDLLKEIGKIYSAVTFTITCSEDNLSKKIEPNAPISSSRFNAIKELSSQGVYTGIALMPILPFINDNEENINGILEKANESGAKYIIPFLGLTLREGSREHYYQFLDIAYPELKNSYENNFGNRYAIYPSNFKKLNQILQKNANKFDIATKMNFFVQNKYEQISIF